MDFIKRISLFTLFLLLIISIYKDLSVRSTPIDNVNSLNGVSVVKVKIQPGDTVLSVTERVNNYTIDKLDLEKVISDFKELNKFADPYNLQINKHYYFPIY